MICLMKQTFFPKRIIILKKFSRQIKPGRILMWKKDSDVLMKYGGNNIIKKLETQTHKVMILCYHIERGDLVIVIWLHCFKLLLRI